MKSILIVEDDTTLAQGLCRALLTDTITTEYCGTIRQARSILREAQYNLILLDVNLPDGNGFDFLKEIKSTRMIPVILLTANDLESDIVSGLEQGADDYITKPFSLAILRARVHNQLNRTIVTSHDCYTNGEYSFNFSTLEFTRQGKSVELSKTEQKLLHILVANEGHTITRNMLMDKVWSDGALFVDENALSVTISRLRSKLSAKDRIRTVYGIGYMWVKNDAAV